MARSPSPPPPDKGNNNHSEVSPLQVDHLVKTPYGWARVLELRPDGSVAVKLEWHAIAYLRPEDIGER